MDDEEFDKPTVQDLGDEPRVEEASKATQDTIRCEIVTRCSRETESASAAAPPPSAPIVVEPTSNPVVAAALVRSACLFVKRIIDKTVRADVFLGDCGERGGGRHSIGIGIDDDDGRQRCGDKRCATVIDDDDERGGRRQRSDERDQQQQRRR
jgi:hypothetical protein